MNLQQRLLFQAATSEQMSRITDHVAAIVTLQKHRFRPCGWIAVILALLFFTSCASPPPAHVVQADHPERTNRGILWQQSIPYVDKATAKPGELVGDTNKLRTVELHYYDEPVRR